MKMNSSEIIQGAEAALSRNNRRKRWITLVVALALVVTIGTIAALRIHASAMNHKKTVMACTYQVHQHDASCYDSQGYLICGYADYVVHQHDINCYDEDGNLICELPEVEEHTHTDACYAEAQVLVCGLEESAGHVHSDSCYTWERGDLVCGCEEHVHSDACYDEEGNLVCGYEEHTHSDDCYNWDWVLTCGMEEGEGGHTHTADCYQTQYTLVCDKPEVILHTHVAYDPSNPDAYSCYDAYGNLTCGMLQVEEHQHTADCLEEVDMTEDEIAAVTAEDSTQVENRIFVTTEDEETEVVEDTSASGEASAEAAEAVDASASGEAEAEVPTYTLTYIGSDYTVTATYTDAAGFPDDITLSAEELLPGTEEYDTEYQQAQDKLNESFMTLDGEDVAVEAMRFFDVKFVDSLGTEYEPNDYVNVVIACGNAQEESGAVIHFAEDGPEIVESTVADGEYSFANNSFSTYVVVTFQNQTLTVGQTVSTTGNTSGYYPSYYDKWSSSNSAVVNVDSSSGYTVNLSAVAAGTATITHKYYNYGSQTESITITVSAASAVTITDNIASTGTLDAAYTGDKKNVQYVWYRSTDGTTWEQVELVEYVTGAQNISTDGTKLYPSVDGGAQLYYKVEVQDKDNSNTVVATSSSYQVPYFSSLQNGSFETPGQTTQSYVQYSNSGYKSAGGVWQTTGLGSNNRDIEIVYANNSSTPGNYAWYNGSAVASDARAKELGITEGSTTAWAPDGTHFAELNCEACGALYQDVLTTPGTSLNWWLNHRGRGTHADSYQDGTDTMYLLIMSTAQASQLDLTSNTAVMNVINNISSYSGAAYWKFTSDDQTWHFYTSDGTSTDADGKTLSPYTVPEGQYLTRFFFVAGSTASGNSTIGNFLDDVGFTTGAPKVKEGTGMLEISKTMTGIVDSATYTAAKAGLSFTVVQVNDDGTEIEGTSQTVTASDLAWSATSATTYTGTWYLQNLTAGAKYKVTENNASGTGYTLNSTTIASYDADDTSEHTHADGSTATVTIVKNKTEVVDVINSYTSSSSTTDTTDPSASKTIVYNSSDDTYDLTLSFTPPSSTTTTTTTTGYDENAKVHVIFVLDASKSMADNTAGNGSSDTRWAKTKETVNTLAGNLNSNTNIDVLYSLVTFNKTATTWTSSGSNTYNYVAFSSNLTSASTGQGTNYQAGLEAAKNITTPTYTSQSGETKSYTRIVIFITDGCPTNSGSTGSTSGGYTTTTIYDASITAARALSADQFYGIGIWPSDTACAGCASSGNAATHSNNTHTSDGAHYEVKTLLTNVTNAVNATTKTPYTVTTATALSTLFEGLKKQIESTTTTTTTSATVTSVTTESGVGAVITDNLSDYVDIVPGSTLTITVTNATGSQTQTGTVNEAGTATDQDSSFKITENGTDYYLAARYQTLEDGTRQVVLQAENSAYVFNKDYIYSVTFKVKTSDAGYDEYALNGYGSVVGDANTDGANTDGANNTTSSGKAGLHSNASATVQYSFNGTATTGTFPHPVVQADKAQLTVTKYGVGTTTLEGVVFRLQRKANNSNVYSDYKFPGADSFQTYTTDPNGQFTVTGLPTGDYKLVETSVGTNYAYQSGAELTFSVKNGRITGTGVTQSGEPYALTADNSGNPTYLYSYTASVTDQLQDAAVTVKKTDADSGNALAGAVFTLQKDGKYYDTATVAFDLDSVTDAAKLTSDDAGTLDGFPAGLATGTYTLTEITAPNGYNLLTAPVTIVVETGTSGSLNVRATCGTNTTPLAAQAQVQDEDGNVQYVANTFTITIANSSGSMLPSTGGIGTTIFYVVGGILVIGAGVILVAKGRMKKRGSDED